jgi:transposase-like protein
MLTTSTHLDPNIHTNGVEGMWMQAKRKLKRQFGTSRTLFPSYLNEFMWQNTFRQADKLSAFLVSVAETFPI